MAKCKVTLLSRVQQIWQFINFNHPTRKELTCYILNVDVKDYKKSMRGQYGTNIAEWKRKGHVAVIDKKYTITPESLKDNTGRMYIALPSIVDGLANRKETRRQGFQLSEVEQKLQELRQENRVLRAKLERIHSLSNLY